MGVSTEKKQYCLVLKNHLGTFVCAPYKDLMTLEESRTFLKDLVTHKYDPDGEKEKILLSDTRNYRFFPRDIWDASIKIMMRTEDLEKLQF